MDDEGGFEMVKGERPHVNRFWLSLQALCTISCPNQHSENEYCVTLAQTYRNSEMTKSEGKNMRRAVGICISLYARSSACIEHVEGARSTITWK